MRAVRSEERAIRSAEQAADSWSGRLAPRSGRSAPRSGRPAARSGRSAPRCGRLAPRNDGSHLGADGPHRGAEGSHPGADGPFPAPTSASYGLAAVSEASPERSRISISLEKREKSPQLAVTRRVTPEASAVATRLASWTCLPRSTGRVATARYSRNTWRLAA